MRVLIVERVNGSDKLPGDAEPYSDEAGALHIREIEYLIEEGKPPQRLRSVLSTIYAPGHWSKCYYREEETK